jgi:hypothetical protein
VELGVNAGFVPSRFLGARRSLQRIENLVTRESSALRYSNQWVSLTGRYNVSRTRRFEFRAGVRRTGFAWQTITRVIDQEARKTLDRDESQTTAGRPVRVAEAVAAFVVDTAVSGPTSPVVGERLRLEVEPAVGELMYTGIRIDARRYFMPFRPLTIATRVEHSGRYGPGASDPRLTPMIIGSHRWYAATHSAVTPSRYAAAPPRPARWWTSWPARGWASRTSSCARRSWASLPAISITAAAHRGHRLPGCGTVVEAAPGGSVTRERFAALAPAAAPTSEASSWS